MNYTNLKETQDTAEEPTRKTTILTEQDLSPVNKMFHGRSILITGASGFIGRVLLEKLLRTYPGIKRIYILMRSKKNKQPYERLHKQLLNVPIFDQIRAMESAEGAKKLLEKIVVVPGDIGEPGLGISEADMKTMLEDKTLSFVFHSAATVRFDDPLKISINLNLIATKTVIDICRKLPNLLCLCHVSTAYANSDIKDQQPIEEKLYPMREKPEHLMQLAEVMDEELMQTLKLKLIDQRPNTYTYTKALAEHLIMEQAQDLPVAIVRPSIVVASWREPLRGWIDNLNGPTGLILAIGKGLMRSMHVTRSVKADIIPVDIVVNTMIASAYYGAKVYGKLALASSIPLKEPLKEPKLNQLEAPGEQQSQEADSEKTTTATSHTTEQRVISNNHNETLECQTRPPVIHCNSGDLNPITWGEMEDTFFPIIRNYPSCQVLRYPFGSFKGNRYHDLLTRIFVHYLPALIIDMLCVLMGKKRQLLSIYYKLHLATEALSHFANQNYNFKTKNLHLVKSSLEDERDKRDLYMDIENLSWLKFWDDYVLGARRFVLKEEDHTLQEARKSFLKAYYIEIGLRAILLVLVSLCCLPLLMRFGLTFPIRSAMQPLQWFN